MSINEIKTLIKKYNNNSNIVNQMNNAIEKEELIEIAK
jgi:hypothetical protein